MLINTHNDWDPLEEIIVGHAHGTRVNTDISSHSFNFSTLTTAEVAQLGGPLPQTLIDEANEDIQGLADTLTNLGVRVHRPALIDQAQEFSTPDWSSAGNSTWCPRDLILPLGDWLIETPSPVRGRVTGKPAPTNPYCTKHSKTVQSGSRHQNLDSWTTSTISQAMCAVAARSWITKSVLTHPTSYGWAVTCCIRSPTQAISKGFVGLKGYWSPEAIACTTANSTAMRILIQPSCPLDRDWCS